MSTLIVGSILAFAIAFSQFLTVDCVSSVEKVKTEQAGEKAGDETASYISLPSFSLPAPVHVPVNLNPYCLFEIIFEKDPEIGRVDQDILLSDRFFQTMFRVIICPNAP